MILRQSDLKTWMKCPLIYRWQNIDKIPRLQGGSASFGSIIHDCILYMEINQDLEGAIERFLWYWADPTRLDPEYRIDYYENGRNWKKFNESGPRLLTNWWAIIQWDTAHVIAREYEFEVPIGDGHFLHGTIDKLELRYVAKTNEWVVMVSDYKTNAKVPTYGYLAEDLQFSSYCYATLQPEFWTGIENGADQFRRYASLPRHGEWVHLTGPKRMEAGVREARHYNRLIMAVNAMAESIAMRIFVPNISGESCLYCDFRAQCGLPPIEE